MESDDEITINRLELSLERQLKWIQGADAKISFIFAADAAMLGFVAATFKWDTCADWTHQITALLALTLLGLSVLMASLANFPRTTGPKGSIIFFKGISEITPEEFLNRVQKEDTSGYINDLSAQCHRNATIAAKKFKWVQRSSLALYFGIVPWLLYLALSFNN